MRLERRLGYKTEGRQLHAHACKLHPQQTSLVWSGSFSLLDMLCNPTDLIWKKENPFEADWLHSPFIRQSPS